MSESVPTWVQLLQEQDLNEELQQLTSPVKLLNPKSREFVWKLCNAYRVVEDGIMGQSCNLLERYVAKKVKAISRNPSRTQKKRMYQAITHLTPLFASVCISLSTNMLSSEQHISHTIIRDHLGQIDILYTMDQIKEAALNVLKCFDNSLPLLTNVQKAMLFAKHMGMSGPALKKIPVIMNLTELYRSDIQKDILSLAYAMGTITHRFEYANVRHLHLVGGTVLAAGRLFNCCGPDFIQRLSALSRCHHVYLKYIADIVEKQIVKNEAQINNLFVRPR